MSGKLNRYYVWIEPDVRAAAWFFHCLFYFVAAGFVFLLRVLFLFRPLFFFVLAYAFISLYSWQW
jgi:hypothetical protein